MSSSAGSSAYGYQGFGYGLKGVFISRENVQEALLVKGLTVYGVENLRQVVEHLQNHRVLSPACKLQQTDCSRLEADLGRCRGSFWPNEPLRWQRQEDIISFCLALQVQENHAGKAQWAVFCQK